ncbi:MAG: family 78 glycoside hydrolase catalytic domain [Fimbriimonadaceae bacterium]
MITLIALGFAIGAPPMTATDLRCEYRRTPLGIDSRAPRLSWIVSSQARGARQSAYRIAAASSREMLGRGKFDLWDTGKVASSKTIQVEYAGKPLVSAQTVYWMVRIWDGKDTMSSWSSPATWTMGLLNEEDWKAKWIAFEPEIKKDYLLPYLRKEFTLEKTPRRVLAFVTGLGAFQLFQNGRRVGKDFLTPAWTDYKDSIHYSTYNLTGQITKGRNAVGIMLGNSMYHIPPERYAKFRGSYGPPQAIVQLRIEYADGSNESVVSDESWKAAPGPITFSSIYGGEDYDARLEQIGWSEAGFDDGGWQTAKLSGGPGGRLVSAIAPPLRLQSGLVAPQAVAEPKPGVFVYDLGKNFSGIPELSVVGPAGTTVKATPSELLGSDGLADQRSGGGGPMYYSYTTKGQGIERWAPMFSYTGFRYLQVEGAPAKPVVYGRVLASSVASPASGWAEPTGAFECSDPLVNRIYSLIDAAIRSNMQHVLTDCPHREKLGWLEQAHLMGPAIMYSYDVPSLYAKIQRDMAEAQESSGLVPDIAPAYTRFEGGFWDSPEWGSAAIMNPWLMYRFYGDTRILRESYPMMKRYLDYLTSKSDNGLLSHGLGDWYDVGPGPLGESQLTSKGITASVTYYQTAIIMRDTARLLKKRPDAATFGALAEQIKIAFNAKFFNKESGQYDRGSQTANAMPLATEMVPLLERMRVRENLVKEIEGREYRVTAGDVGFRYVVDALTGGNDDTLYKMVTQENGPGYAYQLAQGATTLTESWNAQRTSSWNHFMLGHAQKWFYDGLGGIAQEEDSVAFDKIIIRPAMLPGLKWAKCSYRSVRGPIVSEWRWRGMDIIMKVVIPVGSTARVRFPGPDPDRIKEGGRPVTKSPGVTFLGTESLNASWAHVKSGAYEFVISPHDVAPSN